MERIFFVAGEYRPGLRASVMEQQLFSEMRNQYMHCLVRAGDIDGIVADLQERQLAYCKRNPRRKQVRIEHVISPGSCQYRYIHIGNSSFTLIEVQGEIPKC